MNISVVIATYNRVPSLKKLLNDLNQQTYRHFEVIVVDDGSHTPAHLKTSDYAFSLQYLVQSNQGAAHARDRGIQASQSQIIVILDDDMHVQENFLEQHLAYHQQGYDVVLGYIASSDALHSMPPFEKFHAYQLEKFAQAVQHHPVSISGTRLCTGNVSFKKSLYIQVGGFDFDLKRSEDRELGLRFQKAGASFVFGLNAKSTHHSDHTSFKVWRQRAQLYGEYDYRIYCKHPDVQGSDPWRYWHQISFATKMIVSCTRHSRFFTNVVGFLVMMCAYFFDFFKLERIAIAASTLCYGIDYFYGLTQAMPKRGFLYDVLQDYQSSMHYRKKYHQEHLSIWHLPIDIVQKIGFQMCAMIRLMQFFQRHHLGLLAKIQSRLIRLVYAAEIHWAADIEPGISIVHGNGLVIGHGVHVSKGCILFQNVTLGEGVDSVSRQVGAPYLEKNVHIGPGATLIGPICVGEGSKIMAGVCVAENVPGYSVVKPSPVVVQSRHLK